MDEKMTTNEFQSDYIEFLKERNTKLLDKLNHMEETYKNKLLSSDFNKRHVTKVLNDVLSICKTFPQEIDSFFDKMAVAMSALKNILVRKSEMEQMVGKILEAMNSSNDIQELFTINGSGLTQETNRKTETVKVSPMIEGHVISTNPKIYLSRMSGVYWEENETNRLSPIIEASPEDPPESSSPETHRFKTLQIPLERINCNLLPYNTISERESPKSRFKGPKTWKKSLFLNKCQSDNNRNSGVLENAEDGNRKISEQTDIFQPPDSSNPLEGPSWLYNDNSEVNSSSSQFLEFKRRKNRFAKMFDNDEKFDSRNSYSDENRNSLKKYSNEFSVNQELNEKREKSETMGERLKNGSLDLFSDSSFSEDDERNISSKKRQGTKRYSNRKATNNNASFHKNTKSLNSSSKREKRSSVRSSLRSDSDEEDYSESSDQSFRKSQKSNGKASIETSRNTSNEMRNVFVELQDCMVSNESINTAKKKIKSTSRKKKLGTQVRESYKRKAAPTFKLTEPTLNRKLRRSK